MPGVGLEPTRHYCLRILSPLCLPFHHPGILLIFILLRQGFGGTLNFAGRFVLAKFAETWARIELAYSSFAENRLTTWPPGRFIFDLEYLRTGEHL